MFNNSEHKNLSIHIRNMSRGEPCYFRYVNTLSIFTILGLCSKQSNTKIFTILTKQKKERENATGCKKKEDTNSQKINTTGIKKIIMEYTFAMIC